MTSDARVPGRRPVGAVRPGRPFLAVALFAASLVPFFVLVGLDYRAVVAEVAVWLLAVATRARALVRAAAVSVAALLMLLTLNAPEASS